jgi:hypothetical protein
MIDSRAASDSASRSATNGIRAERHMACYRDMVKNDFFSARFVTAQLSSGKKNQFLIQIQGSACFRVATQRRYSGLSCKLRGNLLLDKPTGK